MLEITAVGGYSEVGKNMTLVRYKDEAVILDMGLNIEKYIDISGDGETAVTSYDLKEGGAVPDDSKITHYRSNVIAIATSHAHLDHIGAIQFLAAHYDADIFCTPFTAHVLEKILDDNNLVLPNQIKKSKTGKIYRIGEYLSLEFVHVTHSTPHSSIIIVHTPEGAVVYANDFKLDKYPTLGKTTNIKRLEAIGKKGVKALVIEALYADRPGHTPSEKDARDDLKDVMDMICRSKDAVFITTFSSHIARLKSIVEFGLKTGRKIVFLGRSLAKYVYAAEEAGIIRFSDKVEVCAFPSQIRKALGTIEKQGRDKYIAVCTGHQGEEKAVLSRITDKKLGFGMLKGDKVIFSCQVIPAESNIRNRKALEKKLRTKGVELFLEVHASGHAFTEDHKDLIRVLNPETVIPSHAGDERVDLLIQTAKECGVEKTYKLSDGDTITP